MMLRNYRRFKNNGRGSPQCVFPRTDIGFMAPKCGFIACYSRCVSCLWKKQYIFLNTMRSLEMQHAMTGSNADAVSQLTRGNPANAFQARGFLQRRDQVRSLVEGPALRVAHLREGTAFAGHLNQVAGRPVGDAET